MVHIAVHSRANLVQLLESVKRIDLIHLPLKQDRRRQPLSTISKTVLSVTEIIDC